MSKIQLPPKRNQSDTQEDKPAPKISEKKIQDIINKGGSPTKSAEPVVDRVKNFNLSVLESDLDIIGKLCNQRPKKPGRVIAFSKKDWLLEAVQEKIERERKKYKL